MSTRALPPGFEVEDRPRKFVFDGERFVELLGPELPPFWVRGAATCPQDRLPLRYNEPNPDYVSAKSGDVIGVSWDFQTGQIVVERQP